MNVEDRLADVKVGIFVLAALAILVTGSLWLAGSSFLRGERVGYRIAMNESGGIKAGDRVRFAGVTVGRVRAVSLDPDAERPVGFHVSLDPEIPLRADSTARIATSGLLGASFLEIGPGSPGAPLLEPGGEILGEAGLGLEEALNRMDQISGQALDLIVQTADILEQISTDIGPILAGVQQLFSEKNMGEVQHLLADLHRVVEATAPRVGPLVDRLDSLTASLDTALEDVPELTHRFSALVAQIQTVLGPDGSRLSELLLAAQESLEDAGDLLSAVGENRADIDATMHDLSEVVANLKAFSQIIKERPFSLVRIKVAPDRRPGDGVTEVTP